MPHPLLAIVATAALLGGNEEEGLAWLREAEAKLYIWPKPGSVIEFSVKTDVVENTIEMLRKQLPPNPDPESVRAIQSLRRIKITGSVDTETGKVSTDVDIPLDTADPNRQAGVERMRQGIQTMVESSFQGLPFHDSALLPENARVVEARGDDASITVRIAESPGGVESTIRLDRRRMLPTGFESGGTTTKVRFTEVLPGRFAPAFLEIHLADGQKSTATFSYQRVGELVFPSTVVVEHAVIKARLQFLSVRAQKRARS